MHYGGLERFGGLPEVSLHDFGWALMKKPSRKAAMFGRCVRVVLALLQAAKLDDQSFAGIRGSDAGRIKALKQSKSGLRLLQRTGLRAVCKNFGKRLGQKAFLVEISNEPLDVCGAFFIDARAGELLEQMLRKRSDACDVFKGISRFAFVIGGRLLPSQYGRLFGALEVCGNADGVVKKSALQTFTLRGVLIAFGCILTFCSFVVCGLKKGVCGKRIVNGLLQFGAGELQQFDRLALHGGKRRALRDLRCEIDRERSHDEDCRYMRKFSPR